MLKNLSTSLILILLLFSLLSSACGDNDCNRLDLFGPSCAPHKYSNKKENKSAQLDSSITPQKLHTSADAENDKN